MRALLTEPGRVTVPVPAPGLLIALAAALPGEVDETVARIAVRVARKRAPSRGAR